MDRRGFLGALLAGAMAPAIVRADSLMRVAPLRWVVYGDGVHDDTAALQALLSGAEVHDPAGRVYRRHKSGLVVPSGRYRITDTLSIRNDNTVISGCVFDFSEIGDSGRPWLSVEADYVSVVGNTLCGRDAQFHSWRRGVYIGPA